MNITDDQILEETPKIIIENAFKREVDHWKYEPHLFNDHFQNYKSYNIPKAQLIIADIPYNIGINAYGSNPSWYIDGDNKNGESKLAGKEFFDTDKDFRITEFLHFCSTLLIKEPKEAGKAPCMIVFCAFEQQFELIEKAKKYGLNKYINLVFRKNFSAQVLKANMRPVGNCEYAILLYRDKLPKFNNHGKMVFNCLDWIKDSTTEKIHPCLPANEKVFFNNQWKNIQDVNIDDINSYGKVIAKTGHYANKLIEITVGEDVTIATFNHPFLIKRGSKIYWIIAEQITKNDEILVNFSVSYTQKPVKKTWKEKQRKRDISGSEKTKLQYLNMFLFGKIILEKSLEICRYTIGILTRQTIILETYNLLAPLNTSGCTLVADLSMENRKSHVRLADNIKKLMQKIGIYQGGGLMEKSVSHVLSKSPYKSERFLLKKVGSVKIILEKTKVYNLSIEGIPAFDTLIGVSHNTQKPVKLLERLIEIFTDKGDVVIDPVAGSGSTLLAAIQTGRRAYGFEIKKDFYKLANEKVLRNIQRHLF